MVRLECVARIARLLALNGSPVTPPERRDAEIRYLRRVITHARQNAAPAQSTPSDGQVKPESKSDEASGSDGVADVATSTSAPTTAATSAATSAATAAATSAAEVSGAATPDVNVDINLHPRFQDLVATYGMLASGGVGEDGQSNMAQDMINLCLKPVFAAAWDKPPQVKKLPGSLTVGKLKLLLERMFKIPAAKQSLFVKAAEGPVPEALTEDNESLAYMGVGEGSTILVDELED